MSTQPLSSIHAQFLKACEDKLKQIGYIDQWGKELSPELADMRLPKSIFHFRNDSINERQIRDAKPLWRDIWYENECVCLFGDPNVGKSTLALDIASEVANNGRNDDSIKRHLEHVLTRKCLRFEHIDNNVKETQLLYLPVNDSDEKKLTFIHDTFARGWSIRNTAAHCNTSKSTVHRLLAAITSEEKNTKLSQDQDEQQPSPSKESVKALRAAASQSPSPSEESVKALRAAVSQPPSPSKDGVKVLRASASQPPSPSKESVKALRAAVSQSPGQPCCPVIGDTVAETEEKKEPKLSQDQDEQHPSPSKESVKALRAAASQPPSPSKDGVKVLRASVSQSPEQSSSD